MPRLVTSCFIPLPQTYTNKLFFIIKSTCCLYASRLDNVLCPFLEMKAKEKIVVATYVRQVLKNNHKNSECK